MAFAGKFAERVVLELEEAEARALLRLLEEHQYYGWVEASGEFGLEASGEVSPALTRVYRRIRALATGSPAMANAGFKPL